MAHREDEYDDDEYDDAGFLQYQQARAEPAGRGRTSFIPIVDSPGPAAYEQNVQPIKELAARAAFGTSKRENEEHRFISSLHSAAVPPEFTPGPGTYRVAKADTYPRSPTNKSGPSWRFGTGQQRPDTQIPEAPGPVYNQDPGMSSIAYTFAPQGNIELGMNRLRTDDSRVFISKAHAVADRTTLSMETPNVGPGLYDLPAPESESPRRRAPTIPFDRANKESRNSYTAMQLTAEPMAGTPAKTPGPVYEYPSTLNKTIVAKFGKGPKTYAPEQGTAKAGPYISRLHEPSMFGATSPGPGAYSAVAEYGQSRTVGGLGDAPAFGFGNGNVERSPIRKVQVPGPGAYTPKEDTSSRAFSAPNYSIASSLRTEWTHPHSRDMPGPGAYEVPSAARMEARKPSIPAYSFGSVYKEGRSSFVRPSSTPGPNQFVFQGSISPKGKGYSFGMREKTKHDKSTVSIRYHGPLAAQEGLGTESPGPGIYDVREVAHRLSTHRESGVAKFGTSNRAVESKVYISAQHAQAEGSGLDSPGPGAYDQNKVELANVTSRYRKPAAAAFGTSARFKMNYSTF